MTEEIIFNNVFHALKPACDNLILEVNQKTVNNLNYLLDTLPAKAVQQFQSYIIFPIELKIHNSSRCQQTKMLIDLLYKLLNITYIESDSTVLRLSVVLYQQVFSGTNKLEENVSEELKLSVVQCVAQIWRSALPGVLEEIYSKCNYPRVSPIVFMLVQLAKNEKLIQLRVAALECLQVLCCVHDSDQECDSELRKRAQNIVTLMLPGIVSCCFSISSEPVTQNHKITCANIELWSRVVCFVMADRDSAETQVCISSPNHQSPAEQIQSIQRTTEWLKDTAKKLTPVTEALLRNQTHSHWKVRCKLAHAANLLLKSCPRNLQGSVGFLVCCLIVLSEDEMLEVRGLATKALSEFSIVFENEMGQPLLQQVESEFYSLLSRAPRILQGTDEKSQLTCLSLLVGYLRLQGVNLPQILSCAPFLHRLLDTLIHICRLDTSHISLLEDCSIREVEAKTVIGESWKQFRYLNSVKKAQRLDDVCEVLRQYADLHIVIHALLDKFECCLEDSKEIVLLLNTILSGGGADSMVEQAELVKTVISVYIQPRTWNVPLSMSQPGNAANSILEAQSNIVLVSLLAEGLGQFALAIGKKHFSECLLHCLYLLLEYAGSPLDPLAAAGLVAVRNVAWTCVGAGVTELICDNVDYLSHHITLHMRRANHDPSVLRVLTVVMRYTSLSVLPCLQEIIEDVLAQSYDEFQEHNTNEFLRVFLIFVRSVRNWQPIECDSQDTQTEATSLGLVQELLKYRQLRRDAVRLDDDEISEPAEITEETFALGELNHNETENETEPTEEKPKMVAPVVKLTVAVLERSLNFLPSKDQQRQILVLDILREGVMVLQLEEDQLLPVVHKMWSPLVNRFLNFKAQPLVMHHAFLLLCTLGNTARDFIRSRTLKQVVPAVCQTLSDTAADSLLKDTGSSYRLTQQFKLQRALLNGLGRLMTDLALSVKDVHSILVAVSPYLSDKQPQALQELCKKLYKEVGSSHPYLVWLQLLSLWSPFSVLKPLSPEFAVIQWDTCCDETSEFKKNVSELTSVYWELNNSLQGLSVT